MKKSVLYLSYTGLLEPLGRSQVMAYLKRSSKIYKITLVTFEKPVDFANRKAMDEMLAECRLFSIDWIPRCYHQRPRLFATLYDLALLTVISLRYGWRERVSLVHCRGYVTAISAWFTRKLTRTPFVFDMRALWLDEMILADRLVAGSVLERLLRWVEQRLLRDAGTVVSLSEAAVAHLKRCDPALERQHFAVIPTCVDLDAFGLVESSVRPPSNAPVLGSVGTIASGWFPLEQLVDLYRTLVRLKPDARLKVVTKDNPKKLISLLQEKGLNLSHVSVLSCASHEVPKVIAGMSFGVVLNIPSIGRLGSMPTRMAEFLACGIPVIGNHGVGDVAELINYYRIGVVIKENEKDNLMSVVIDLLKLLEDSELESRCRNVAESHFSADHAAVAYASIWDAL